MNFESIIKSPIVTEKTNSQTETQNRYSFRVNKSASKGAVKIAIEKLFNVKVVEVNMMPIPVKAKRSLVGKRLSFQTKQFKKAIIKLAEKNSIDLIAGGKK